MSYQTSKIYGNSVGGGSSSGGGGSVTTFTYAITGTTNINLLGKTGEVIINVTSTNPTETLLSFSNHTAVTKITLRPAVGLLLTANDGDPSLKLYAPTLDINGTNFGFLELTKRGTAFRETNYIDQYN